jgi:RNA polymerase sigma-70 factor (ECF subfamily)
VSTPDRAPGQSTPSGASLAEEGVESPGAERTLIAAIRAGDTQALAKLYDLHAPAMLGLAHRVLRDRGDAEDLVHDVFLEAWKKVDAFAEERGRMRTWLLVRVRSRAIDRLRSLEVARRHVRREEPPPNSPPQRAAEDPAASPDRARARGALAALPDAQRLVLELAYFEGLTCSEIAARCDTPLGTVKSRLLAGMRELRRHFDASGIADGV